jgi:hypothetical protein
VEMQLERTKTVRRTCSLQIPWHKTVTISIWHATIGFSSLTTNQKLAHQAEENSVT